jgi:RNA polymerase sigma factor (sigma-70 family)
VEEIASLVARARDGDKDAFNALVRRFQDAAVGYAYGRLGDFQLAEDAAQEAFLTAWRELRKLREAAAFPGWFRQIVHTQCHRLTRGKALLTVPLGEAVEVATRQPDPAAVAEANQQHDRVSRAVATLHENERMVIALFYLGGYSLAEISEFLAVPLNTSKSRLHKGRKRLRERMIQMAEEDLRGRRPSRNEEFARRVMALLNASAVGDQDEVERLLGQSKDADGELANAGGPHPYWGGEPHALHVAAEWGRAEVVELLLRQGADPNVRSAAYDHWSPASCCGAARKRIGRR